ncbi:MAG: arylsulfatase [Candidatus Marinimicrobia bacterium]|nr:arylsulfatase [Candidatus Neomarinimicrobiota bacterium]
MVEKNSRRSFLKTLALGSLGTFCLSSCGAGRKKLPNILYILADDLGYGDVKAFNCNCKIPTPHLNNLALNGMIFRDAHASSSVCTPTRYGILTGRYNWRSRLKSGVLAGYSPALIEEGRMTVASFLKEQGYATACIGKWHLGWNWATKNEYVFSDDWNETGENVDFNRPVRRGPRAVGFDYNFCIPASLDIAPYVFLENDQVEAPPTRLVEKRDGYEFFRSGPAAQGFIHEEVLSTFTQKSLDWIRGHKDSEHPFFLYFALSAPHTPILPSPEFQGKSGLGPYGDFVMQCDGIVGQIIQTLKEIRQYENTLVLFASDNGCSPMANYEHLESQGHDPSYIFRGHKADIFEGGHRIPLIACWPAVIKKNSESKDLVCLTDLLATVADISGKKLPDNAAEDSVSMLPVFQGKPSSPVRETIVHHSINGSFSIRKGKWKLEFCPGSGGWSEPTPAKARAQHFSRIQLYDLSEDIGETCNLADQYPRVVFELTRVMEDYVKSGRSTPGKPQANTGAVDFWRHTLVNLADQPTKISHKAKGKRVIGAEKPELLTDGILGTLQYDDGNWTGFEGIDAVMLLDLEENLAIGSLEIGFLQDQESWIFLPRTVTLESSFDNKNFKNIMKIEYGIEKNDKPSRKKCIYKGPDIRARFIKITAENIVHCPLWHSGKDGIAWIFCDEIVVN